MTHYLQYFNCDKMGRFPNGAEAFLTEQMGTFTKLAAAKDAAGGTVFLIVGLGKPKRYYLWETFTVTEVRREGEEYVVTGAGRMLLPPRHLHGEAFEAFKAACAHFIGFRSIDTLPYLATLRRLAEQHQRGEVGQACEDFCTELVGLLPKDGDACYYRATVRRLLGKAAGAREDFARALELGTNFRAEAEAGLRDPGEPAAKGKVVKQPAGAPSVVARGARQKGGKEEFRRQLLRAYGGRCAVTGWDGEPALEAAVISGDADTGPYDVGNGLLLRADIRALFEQNLLRIHPRTRKLFLGEQLLNTSYGRLAARQLRLPEKEEDRPSAEALRQRWEAGANV
jgi:hypothetical protein